MEVGTSVVGFGRQTEGLEVEPLHLSEEIERIEVGGDCAAPFQMEIGSLVLGDGVYVECPVVEGDVGYDVAQLFLHVDYGGDVEVNVGGGMRLGGVESRAVGLEGGRDFPYTHVGHEMSDVDVA